MPLTNSTNHGFHKPRNVHREKASSRNHMVKRQAVIEHYLLPLRDTPFALTYTCLDGAETVPKFTRSVTESTAGHIASYRTAQLVAH